MKIFLQPRETLIALVPGSAVTTRRFTARNTNELSVLSWSNLYFLARTGWSESEGERNHAQRAQNTSEHVLDATGNRGGKPFQNLATVKLIPATGKFFHQERGKCISLGCRPK